ncbi:group II intron reverse transcriptase/maturase [Candidatus Poribacteria bacterium]|nr:group II intron reverse transcriptase/maturase [Candidatus Poribacteria bacterium]
MDLIAQDENQVNTCHLRQSDTLFTPENISDCEKYILTIQRRLDKAVANDDKFKIKWYTHLLMKRSRAVKILSVYRVCSVNQGKYTAGVDGVSMPKEKVKRTEMMIELLNSIDILQKPQPIRRVFIPKPNGTKRPLGIPTISDRINQDIIRQTIEPICEYHFKTCSYGFRPKRSCQDAMSDLFNKLGKPNSRRWIIEGDIKGCFDNINHGHIISTMRKWNITNPICRIVRKMLKSDIMWGNDTTPSTSGTPQGGIISPMLANIALTCLDEEIEKVCGRTGRNMSWIVRYADDFIIVAVNEQDAKEIRKHIKTFLPNHIGVELSDEKTLITEISKGFDFLGFNFRKYKNTLKIKPSKDSIISIKHKIALKIRELSTTSMDILLSNLNPIISGWGHYYRHCVSSDIFAYIDDYVWNKIWQWTKRKHPTRGGKHRRNRYTQKATDNNRWIFYDSNTNKILMKMRSIVIKRFIKVVNDIRVYDANASEYWDKRVYMNAKDSIYGNKTLTELFRRQKGRCEYCNRPITTEQIKDGKLHKHHLKPRSQGGDWKSGNLRLLHSECHTSLHGNITRKDMARFANNGIDYLKIMRFT